MSDQKVYPVDFSGMEAILPKGEYAPSRMTVADESRFTATRTHRNAILPIRLANDKTPDMPEVFAGSKALGNEERFTAAYYSEPLTQYAVGWTDQENLEALLAFIAPRVPVGRRFEYKLAVNAEAFLSEQDDDRAIGAEFKRIEYRGTSATGKTNNRGLTYRLDLDEEGAGILTEELIVARILQRLRRNQVRRSLTALLAACTANTARKWSAVATTNPNEDLRTAALACLTDSGLWPNRVLFDAQAFANRANGQAPLLTAGSWAAYLQKPQDVADFIGIDQGMLLKAVYQNAAATKALLMSNRVIVFQGQDSPSRDDPTNVKRFVTPVGDGDFRVYRQPVGAKFVDISVEYYDTVVGTATVGAQSLTIT